MKAAYDEGQWVEVKWDRVYPPFKGRVKFCTADTACVTFLRNNVEVPLSTTKKCSPPKKKR